MEYRLGTQSGPENRRLNALSPYFVLRLSMRPQKWSVAKGRKGEPIQRRGDGILIIGFIKYTGYGLPIVAF